MIVLGNRSFLNVKSNIYNICPKREQSLAKSKYYNTRNCPNFTEFYLPSNMGLK